MIVFSGYWEVKDNPKPTAKKGHLKHVLDKPIDILFIDRERLDLPFKQYPLPYNQLPAIDLVKKTKSTRCSTKAGLSIDCNVFHQLRVIWISKILLFKTVADMYPDENEFVWSDCVFAYKLDEVMAAEHSGITIRSCSYKKSLFSGKLPNVTLKVSACSIKIHRDNIDNLIDLYIKQVDWANTNLPVYDEEIILSLMYDQRPELFKLV